MTLSHHAQQRMQQRGIPLKVVDYLLAYGRVSHDHHGGCVIWLDKRSREKLEAEEGKRVFRGMDKCLNAYVVTDTDGTVVTVGHRYRRIKRH